MNSLVIVLIAVVVLGAGYLGYGRWLAKKWGVDPNAKTPAVANEDARIMYHHQSLQYLHISFHR